jgi:chaperone modulatory protein CbpM
MLTWPEFCASLEVEVEVVRVWVEEGWILPRDAEGAALFSDMDLARARLIRDLRGAMGVNHEGVGVILDLLDQVHGLRRMLREVLDTRSDSKKS